MTSSSRPSLDPDKNKKIKHDELKEEIDRRRTTLDSIIQKNEQRYAPQKNQDLESLTNNISAIESLPDTNFSTLLPDVKQGDIIKYDAELKIDNLHLLNNILQLNLNTALVLQEIPWAKNVEQELPYMKRKPLPPVGEKNFCAGFTKNQDPCHTARRRSVKDGLRQNLCDCYCKCLTEIENEKRDAVRNQANTYIKDRLRDLKNQRDKHIQQCEEKKNSLEQKKIKEWDPVKNKLLSTQNKIESLYHLVIQESINESSINICLNSIIKSRPYPSAPPEKREGEVDEPQPGTEEKSNEVKTSSFKETRDFVTKLLKQIHRLHWDKSIFLSSGTDKAYFIMRELAHILTEKDNEQLTDKTLYQFIKGCCQEGKLHEALAERRWKGCFFASDSPTKTEEAIPEAISKVTNKIKAATSTSLPQDLRNRFAFSFLPPRKPIKTEEKVKTSHNPKIV